MVTSKPASASAADARPFASPLSRAMARQHGIALTTLAGSGPHGRIVKADVLAHLAGAGQTRAVQEPDDDLPFDAVPNPIGRRLIARRVTESLQQIPHFQVQIDVNVDPVLQLRKQWPVAKGQRPTLNDFVIQAAGRALREVPGVNASYTEAAVRRYRQVNVAVAVSVQDGLRTPVVRDADTRPVEAIAREMQALAAQARDGSLAPAASRGGTFTVSNLGGQGVRAFTAVINPPQGAILAVGSAEARPVVRAGALAIATMMTVTLSADHRHIDGALAANWLAAFRHHLENPDSPIRAAP
jgi:pyruvate dehydrogenase E2 component (dihydrolipoamide acetyltransferase)